MASPEGPKRGWRVTTVHGTRMKRSAGGGAADIQEEDEIKYARGRLAQGGPSLIPRPLVITLPLCSILSQWFDIFCLLLPVFSHYALSSVLSVPRSFARPCPPNIKVHSVSSSLQGHFIHVKNVAQPLNRHRTSACTWTRRTVREKWGTNIWRDKLEDKTKMRLNTECPVRSEI